MTETPVCLKCRYPMEFKMDEVLEMEGWICPECDMFVPKEQADLTKGFGYVVVKDLNAKWIKVFEKEEGDE